MRIPLASNLESRDGTLDQDALVKNGVIELRGEGVPPRLRKRPGVTTAGTQTDKLALLHALARTYITDSTGCVAMGDPSYSTVYGISIDDGENSTACGNYYTWNGSAWSQTGTLVNLSAVSETAAFGAAQLDGYFFLLARSGQLTNSASANDPNTFDFNNDYIGISADGAPATALWRHDDYLLAFTRSAMTVLYNAGNPTGSILSPVRSAYRTIGCINGRSLASIDRTTFWLGAEQQSGPGVYMLRGLEPARISTAAVDKIIAADDFATIYGTGCNAGGGNFYLLTLVTSGITLAYDIKNGQWSAWTSYTAASNKTVSSITRSSTTATVTTSTSHGLSDGDPVTIAGADQAGYNGLFQIAYVSATVFTIEVDSGTVTPATGTITATPYTESYFKWVRYIGSGNPAGAMLEATGTTWYKFSDTTYKDNALPINFFARTPRLDGGTDASKKLARLGVIGDKVSDTAMIRWSDDDSTNFTKYRRVTLSNATPELRRCGAFERRSIEFRHIGNTAPSIDALELDIGR